MNVLQDMTLDFSTEEALNVGGLKRVADRIDNLSELMEECKTLIKPAVVYTYLKIDKVLDGGILVKDSVLSSPKLAEQLKCASEIAPYIMTIGPNLEKRVTAYSPSRLLDSWVLDNLGTYSLRLLARHLEEKIRGEKGWRVSKFNPGSTPSWKLEQQDVLFSIFSREKVQEAIGVILTDKYVMVPRKSGSGIMAEAITAYHNCQECKKPCEYRQRPYTS